MNRLLILPVLLLTLLVGTPVFSADFQKGVTAYEGAEFISNLPCRPARVIPYYF
jgi:hypothetical protein